jgi:hypothetical protein
MSNVETVLHILRRPVDEEILPVHPGNFLAFITAVLLAGGLLFIGGLHVLH